MNIKEIQNFSIVISLWNSLGTILEKNNNYVCMCSIIVSQLLI